MTPFEEAEEVQSILKTKGGEILMERLREHAKASDTLKVFPVVDNNGVVLVTQTEQMLKAQGYVSGVEAALGIIETYLNAAPEDFEDEFQD